MRSRHFLNLQRLLALTALAVALASPASVAEVPVPGTVTDALGWYEREAEGGNREAQFLLARLLEQGLLGKPDAAAAYQWYRAAATNGHPEAQVKMADAYYFGNSLEQNYAQAAAWYGKAAEAGIARAQYNLGFMLERGRGITPDLAKAAALYIEAATAGLGEAQVGLSMMYAQGRGMQKSAVRALMWLNIAAAKGQSVPEGVRETVSSRLTVDQQNEARHLAENWRALRPAKRN